MNIEKDEFNELKERLAFIEHERWSHWQNYMHSKCIKNSDGSLTIPADLASKWERQSETLFSDLTDNEKASDREQVDRYFPELKKFIKDRLSSN